VAKKARVDFPPKVEAEVLFSCKRRCAFCYTLDGDVSVKTNGQIAHIDKNNANNAPSNAAYLCLVHHDEYDSRRSQSKGLTKGELLRCQEFMLKNLNETLWAVSGAAPSRLIRACQNIPKNGRARPRSMSITFAFQCIGQPWNFFVLLQRT
jgi:hypothetical protein